MLVSSAGADQPLPPANTCIPQDALIVLEVSDPKLLLDLLLGDRFIGAVKASPAFKEQASGAEFKQLQNAVEFVEARLDDDWRGILRKLSAGGVTFAVGPDKTTLLIVDSGDEKALKELLDIFVFFAKGDAQKKGDEDRVASADYNGVKTWTFGPNDHHAIVGSRLLLSNKSKGLKAALDRNGKPGGASIVATPGYQAARRAAGAKTPMSLYVNSGVLKRQPAIAKALDVDRNPFALLMLAGLTEVVQESNWLAMGLDVKDDALVMRVTTDGKLDPNGGSAFAVPQRAGQGAMPELAVPRRIVAVSLHRDLHGFYVAKDKLFPERTSELIFFENMMGIFFTGRDLTDEVLSEFGSDVRVVVAGQKYDEEIGTPAVQVPAFAAVFRLKNPKKFNRVAEEAWQKALGLINFTRGQQALPGLIIDRNFHGDVKYSVAYFAAPEQKDDKPADARFNYRPSLAMPEGYMILSSTDALAEDLIDALAKETKEGTKALPGVHSRMTIDGPGLAAILGANREAMIRQNMVEKGNSRKQAEKDIGNLLLIVEHIGETEFEMAVRDGRTEATLRLKLKIE